ncbi:MAG: DNA repair exonuclease [Clostridiales bacterium]|nr:DNA repair exonuclease [Clostridiales bacterium]
MSFRFVHIADVHLDTPFKNRDAHLRDVLDSNLKHAFTLSIDLAIEKDAHAILIAGDLFDDDTLSYKTVKFLQEQIDRLREKSILVFYATGNHDPASRLSKASAIKWADNVYIFSSKDPEAVDVKDRDGKVLARVVGAGHESRNEGQNIAKGFPIADEGISHIGLLHCLMIDGTSSHGHERYAPCTRLDLEEKGYAYWALGHIHTRLQLEGSTYIVYPGNISGRHFGETGAKGAYLVEIAKDGSVDSKFYHLSKTLWVDMTLDISESFNDISKFRSYIMGECHEKLNRELSELYGVETIMLRLNLKGRTPIYHYLAKEEDLNQLGQDLVDELEIEYANVDIESLYPPMDIESLRKGPHLTSYALGLIEEIKKDDSLLLSLMPDELASSSKRAQSQEEILEYLRELTEGLEYEALLRTVKEDYYEI